jgi:hypothetical protein
VHSEADRSDNNLFQFSLRHRPDGACDNRLHAIPAGSSERRGENLHRPGLTAVLTLPLPQWSNVLHTPPSATNTLRGRMLKIFQLIHMSVKVSCF